MIVSLKKLRLLVTCYLHAYFREVVLFFGNKFVRAKSIGSMNSISFRLNIVAGPGRLTVQKCTITRPVLLSCIFLRTRSFLAVQKTTVVGSDRDRLIIRSSIPIGRDLSLDPSFVSLFSFLDLFLVPAIVPSRAPSLCPL